LLRANVVASTLPHPIAETRARANIANVLRIFVTREREREREKEREREREREREEGRKKENENVR